MDEGTLCLYPDFSADKTYFEEPILHLQGVSEAALFTLSEGKKIPKRSAVLLGMLSLTFDILVRIIGQALVLVYAPTVGLWPFMLLFSGVILPFHVVYVRCFNWKTDRIRENVHWFNNNIGSIVLNVIGGIFSPALFSDRISVSKLFMKKYYAFNRIFLSSLLIAQLSVTLNTALRAKGEAYLDQMEVNRTITNRTITSIDINFRIPAEYGSFSMNCTNICLAAFNQSEVVTGPTGNQTIPRLSNN